MFLGLTLYLLQKPQAEVGPAERRLSHLWALPVLFALWGRARTNKEEVRTAGVNGDCVAEVELEHEGHLYVVRRTIAGASAVVRAQAYADGAQVAEGARDTTRYVHSVLGMDDVAFRASVFAEQRHLAAFSETARTSATVRVRNVTPI